jgi:spermidine synthase
MIAIANPFPDEGGVLRLLEPDDCDITKIITQLLNHNYNKPFIIEVDGLRNLYFTRALTQSALRLSAPDVLEFAYTGMMMCVLLFNPQPQHILMLGMGGGSLAKFCHNHLPTTSITVVEINPDVIAFRDQFMLPPDDARLQVVHADAGQYINTNCVLADVIMLDAFDRDGASVADAAQNFYLNIRKNLSSKGVLTANIVGSKATRLKHLQSISSAFSGNIISVPVAHDGNYIVFAFRDSAFEPRWRWMHNQAAAMKKRFGLDFPRFIAALNRSRKDGYLQSALHQNED